MYRQQFSESEQAINLMKQDVAASQLPGRKTCCLWVDLEQILLVACLTHGDMFYFNQLSCDNLGIAYSIYSNSNTAFIYVQLTRRNG